MNSPLHGTVLGVLMNFPREWDALGERMHQPPYQAPPRGPVLYLKPANTHVGPGATVWVPAHLTGVEIGASVGLERGPHGGWAALRLMADLSEPHDNVYRPPVRERCRDGFLVVGDAVPCAGAVDLSPFVVEVAINGVCRQRVHMARLLRQPEALMAQISPFMTLRPGDVLLPGCDRPVVQACAGDVVTLSADGLGTLHFQLALEDAP